MRSWLGASTIDHATVRAYRSEVIPNRQSGLMALRHRQRSASPEQVRGAGEDASGFFRRMKKRTKLLVVGAGPFGLAVAAYAKHHDIDFLMLGKPMGFWKSHMPEGMFLRSAIVHASHRHPIPAFEASDWSWVNPLVDAMDNDPGWFRNLSQVEREELNYRFWSEGRLKEDKPSKRNYRAWSLPPDTREDFPPTEWFPARSTSPPTISHRTRMTPSSTWADGG